MKSTMSWKHRSSKRMMRRVSSAPYAATVSAQHALRLRVGRHGTGQAHMVVDGPRRDMDGWRAPPPVRNGRQDRVLCGRQVTIMPGLAAVTGRRMHHWRGHRLACGTLAAKGRTLVPPRDVPVYVCA